MLDQQTSGADRLFKNNDVGDRCPWQLEVQQQGDNYRLFAGSRDSPNPSASSALFAREELRRAGIDPGRVTVPVAVFEPTEWTTTAPDAWHANLVARMINDRQFGLCPGSNVSVELRQKPFQSARFNAAEYRGRSLSDFAADITADCFNQYSEWIENARRNGVRVVAISSGVHNIGAIYRECLEEAAKQIELNPEARPELVRRILGDRADQYFQYRREQNQSYQRRLRDFRQENEPTGEGVTRSQREEFERRYRAFARQERAETTGVCTDEIKQLVSRLRHGLAAELGLGSGRESSTGHDGVGVVPEAQLARIRQAIQRYENVTRDAARAGMVIVIATGNSGRQHYNILARSSHVISVGAADINNTPGDPRVGHVSPFSSSGNSSYRGLSFDSPTLVAQGSDVPMEHQIRVFGVPRNQRTLEGTSVAAPQVAATIALMLTQNPNLSFAEVRDILVQTARPLPVAPATHRAAGMLAPASPLGAVAQSVTLLGADAPTSTQGAGLLNVFGAVEAARRRRR